MHTFLQTMDFPTYRKLPWLSSHLLFDYLDSPRKARTQTPLSETPAQRLGTAVHAILSGETVEVAPSPGQSQESILGFVHWAHERRRIDTSPPAEWARLRQYANAQKIGLREDGIVYTFPDEIAPAQAMAQSLRDHPIVAELMDGGLWERVIQTSDRKTKLPLKGRIDLITAELDVICEIKTSRNLRTMSYDADKYGYFFQLAMYQRLWCCAAPPEISSAPDVMICAVESSPPYDVRVFNIAEALLIDAYDQVSRALAIYSQCNRKNFWPGPNWDWNESRYRITTLR